MGPVVTGAARDRIVDYIGRGEGDVVVDGRELEIDGDGFWVGPTLIDNVTHRHERLHATRSSARCSRVVRVDTLDEAIELINAQPYANGTAIFTASGHAAREFQRRIQVGMIGVNVPIPVPMAFYSFGGWKDSLFGDHHIHGPEGVRFYTRAQGRHDALARPGARPDPPALPDGLLRSRRHRCRADGHDPRPAPVRGRARRRACVATADRAVGADGRPTRTAWS